MNYQARTIDYELDELLKYAPAIALDGPKGVGKTATASRRAATIWHLDTQSDQEFARADPEFETVRPGTLLLDEWQRVPQVWDSVRRRVDEGAKPARFLLTGSATPTKGITVHTGAGRILALRMRPMGLHERGVEDPTVSLERLLLGVGEAIRGETEVTLPTYMGEIVRSGFPGIRSAALPLRTGLLDGYLQHIIDRDLPEQGLVVRRPATLRRWLQAYAAASSTTTSQVQILKSINNESPPAQSTGAYYRDYLSQRWLIDPVDGWSPTLNPFVPLQVAPKHHLADPALAARLLNLSVETLTANVGAPMSGRLFESLATLTVRVAAQAAGARVGHLRTNNGRNEVDLIVESQDGKIVAIEVKLAAAIDDSDVKHLKWLRERLPDTIADLVVITTGSRAYRRADGVAVVPLALLGA